MQEVKHRIITPFVVSDSFANMLCLHFIPLKLCLPQGRGT